MSSDHDDRLFAWARTLDDQIEDIVEQVQTAQPIAEEILHVLDKWANATVSDDEFVSAVPPLISPIMASVSLWRQVTESNDFSEYLRWFVYSSSAVLGTDKVLAGIEGLTKWLDGDLAKTTSDKDAEWN